MEPQRQILVNDTPYTLQDLYNKYAGMLLGYVSEMVNDPQQAEQHLVSIFSIIPQHLTDINSNGTNTWCQLQRIAKSHLNGSIKFVESGQTTGVSVSSHKNKFSNLMSEEQNIIFCSVYYKGKTTAQLAQELSKPEENIRKCLKEAFAIIRTRA